MQVNSRPLKILSVLEVSWGGQEGRGRNIPDEPEETLGGGVLLGLDLVAAEILDVLGFGRGSKLAITDLLCWGRWVSDSIWRLIDRNAGDPGASNLDVAEHVRLDGGEGDRAQSIYRCMLAWLNIKHELELSIPKMVVRDSAASRNWVVAIALSFSASTGTVVKDCLKVSTMVPPGGMTGADMMTDILGMNCRSFNKLMG